MSPPDTPEPFVFLSYAAADRDRVLDAAGRLRAAGVRVWLDEDGAASGAQIAEA